jgi:hypothetical protein
LLRRKVRARDLRYLIAFTAVVTLITCSVAYGILNPPGTEQFFAMWILGSSGLSEHYYPSDNPNLVIGANVTWTLNIYNHMRSVQYVVVRVKLLNSTATGPDESAGRASPLPPLLEFARVLLSNETWTIPFAWRILNASSKGADLMVTGLSINGYTLSGKLCEAVSGINYRFVFELWSYDQAANDLVFSWNTRDGGHYVWTQIWFNMTISRPA